MTIAALAISAVSVIVSGCSVYWTLQLRKANRELAKIRAERRPSLLQANARRILAEYRNPPPGGALVPRAWVEEHMTLLKQQAE